MAVTEDRIARFHMAHALIWVDHLARFRVHRAVVKK
jgi:hypothetical protein